ncbi:hypothetical protein TWF730_003562 [Orbilia blumenaviensis]|uniref:Uncharacterized protein n=1 Tax=Orbilia blumenaviensis TaxID=1796055 RepID=A0AAV9U6N9_9PEZI
MRFAIGTLALLALSGSASAQCDGVCECVADDCLLDLAGSEPFPATVAVDDCRDYLWEHSTWASETSTVTNVVTGGVVTEIVSETVFATVSEGTTTLETVTNTVTATETTTSGTGTFTGELITTVIPPLRRRRRKRQQGVIPAYASQCGGSVGYISACTCIGVSAGGTLWTEVPLVTATVTETVASTETVSETETATTTVVGDFAGATETETLVKTATEKVTRPYYTGFALQLTNDEANGQYKGYFLRAVPDASKNNLKRLTVVANVNAATLYKINGAGNVVTETGDFGFSHDDTTTGPGFWQEATGGRTGWIGHNCNINADRLLNCPSTDESRIFMAADPTDGNKVRVFAYLENILKESTIGPLIIAAVPQNTASIPPAFAKNVVIRAADTGNGIFNGQYVGVQDQSTQPFPRVRFYETIDDATRFTVDPVSGNVLGEGRLVFSARINTNPAQIAPFLLGGYDTNNRVHHVTVQLPGTSVFVRYPTGPDRNLGAVIPDGSPDSVPFFRLKVVGAPNSLADEQRPLALIIEEV